ncbi:MAG: RcnB family protein, partial [Pseudomonadota bacterium]
APRPAAEPRQVDRPAYRGTGGQPQDAGRRGDGRRGDGGRDEGRRYEGRRDDGRRDGDRRDWDGRRDDRGDRRDWDRRGDDRRDWDRRDRDRRDWDRRDDRRDYRRWERGRYPQVYVNPHRYRYDWRPPSGFYLRSWGYGEFFPRGWFGPGWWIVDAWQYDLPLPPPGFEWVRSGPDALLIDEYSGRIVQVVRNVFWY